MNAWSKAWYALLLRSPQRREGSGLNKKGLKGKKRGRELTKLNQTTH